MKLRFLCLLIFILHCSTIHSEEIAGKAILKQGRDELDCKKYEDAIKNLSFAEKEFPLLGDYALLWLSDAYHETGNHGEALKTIRSLLKKFPDSPLKKKTRSRELTEAQEVPEENMQQLFESFIKDYPKDMEIKYSYARWLQKNNADAAKPIFKDICISACPLSEMACGELSPADMQTRDLIEKASNFMKFMDYKEAESVLRTALEKDDGSLKNEILKNLGLSLFKQKRYSEAAEVYEKAEEKFWKVYSLYRAGGKETFTSSLEELLKSGDGRAGSILIAVASDKRREGEIEKALQIYQNVLEQYPSESENALWGIGWTYFMSGAYEKASEVFARLYENSSDTKYLYWKARSLEASGKDVKDSYHTLRKRNGDFYSAMSFLRMKEPIEQLGTKETMESHGDTGNHENNPPPPPFNSTLTPSVSPLSKGELKGGYTGVKKFERAEALFEIGLSKDALSELLFISKNSTSIEDILYIGSKLQAIGEYRYLVILANRLPAIETVHHLRYPHAYWNIVEPLSQQYSIDPFLVLSVMREESTFDPNARSTAGALGLMQLMPQTAFRLNRDLHLRITNVSHVCNVRNNIHVGTFYLSTLIREFGSYAYALAAYNAGEEKVRKWIQKGNYKSID
ncbi:MAG TPA: transglycosylase SLT domain-containing protein, partial [Thermodesulfovibrionales bacterium]|nr:transglycosylase SLT domain-containing protein [Thermodesulfovibrionales bacterium]